jgi:peptide/nickel transport system substrate-binding protein
MADPTLPGQFPGAVRSRSRRDFLKIGATGAVLLGSGGALAACSSSGTSGPGQAGSRASASLKPKRGGHLRVAVTGGGPTDTVDADKEVNTADLLRVMALYNGLVRLDPTGRYAVPDLAEELIPSPDARTWTVRLRPGVTFHNGKDLTADDVIFTIRRIANPTSPLIGYTALSSIDLAGLRAVDARTVHIPMTAPYATLPIQLTDSYNLGIVPVGYDPKNPVGTGPFKYQSFTPGVQSVFVRNDNYFRPGLPYLDGLTIIDSFQSDTAAYNALQSGQVDVYAEATLTLAKAIGSAPELKALISYSGQWIPFTMRVDQSPFTDVRVRQALRLIVNRPEIVNVAFDGFADVGNDVFGQHDPLYDASFHREQDIPQAKFLLKKAGQEGLSVQLVTSDIAAGAVESAQVLAQQAKAAGVNISLRQLPSGTFFGPNYLKWTFAQDYWDYNPYLSQVAQATLPNSPFNECHFSNPRYIQLYKAANATLDDATRLEIAHEMQLIDFNEGGYIIPAYNKIVDLMTTQVQGFPRGGTGIPLGNSSWETAWLE